MGLFPRRSSKNPLPSPSNPLKKQPSRTSGNGPPNSKHNSSSVPSFSSPSVPDISLPGPPDPNIDPVGYLRSIYSVRERSGIVYEKARRNELRHFDVDWSKWEDVVRFVGRMIKRDYSDSYKDIPPHGRWQHFNVGGRPRVDLLLDTWPSTVDAQERTRRLIDLFLVSVLLDAGAGTQWKYKGKESGKTYSRSEGLAVASYEMFKAGLFSGVEGEPCRVDAEGLRRLTAEGSARLGRGLQVGEGNKLDGLDGRVGLMQRLGRALIVRPEFFGKEGRPGNMLDYLLQHPTTSASSVPVITIPTLWSVLMTGLSPIWPNSPQRTTIDSHPLGDAWPCASLPSSGLPWERVVPFHKLTQWLCYSLMGPMQRVMKVHFAGAELLTGLPEYRNGGLLVDTGLLVLKEGDMRRGEEAFRERGRGGGPGVEVVPLFEVGDGVIVEWRAVTVGCLDLLVEDVNKHLGLAGQDRLSLAQVLEAGSWKGGRELAEVSRPNTKGPPIMILSDGTVF